jgi:hypothetical protein
MTVGKKLGWEVEVGCVVMDGITDELDWGEEAGFNDALDSGRSIEPDGERFGKKLGWEAEVGCGVMDGITDELDWGEEAGFNDALGSGCSIEPDGEREGTDRSRHINPSTFLEMIDNVMNSERCRRIEKFYRKDLEKK